MSIQKATISFRRLYEVEINSSDLPDPIGHEDVLDALLKKARGEFQDDFILGGFSEDGFSAHIIKTDICL